MKERETAMAAPIVAFISLPVFDSCLRLGEREGDEKKGFDDVKAGGCLFQQAELLK